jgi:hypothetical protein
MTISGYVPPAIFRCLLNIGNEQQLAIKEVEWILVRKALEPFGFKCEHNRVGTSKTTGQPFCKDCYGRLEQVKAPRFQGRRIAEAAIYRVLPTFLDVPKKVVL